MYNLHCHSLLSDGCLLPSELAIRYLSAGYKAIAITDHTDYSNIEYVLRSIVKFSKNWPKDSNIQVLPGVELTHLPLNQFKPLAKLARKMGAKIVIGHGETLAEPVIRGTNRAALEADIDILAHPGLISYEDAAFAKERGIFLEITTRKGHAQGNRHVLETAFKTGAKLILSHDAHVPEDIISVSEFVEFMKKEGLTESAIDKIFDDVNSLLKNKGG